MAAPVRKLPSHSSECITPQKLAFAAGESCRVGLRRRTLRPEDNLNPDYLRGPITSRMAAK